MGASTEQAAATETEATVDKVEAETFEASRARTIEALAALEAHWSAAVVGPALRALLADPGGLAEEGHRWSAACGLRHTLPTAALGCEPLAKSTGHDGLSVSLAGGPVVPTHAALLVAPTLCGHGVFATESLAKGTKLGEYLGQARSYDVWCEEIKERKRAARGSDAAVPFIPEELYAAWTGSGPADAGVVVDAFHAGNTMRFINCSCDPNATFTPFGRGYQKHSRLVVVATRDIRPWEQLSVNYGWYYDDATLQDVRKEALRAYNRDLAELRALGAWACGRQAAEARAERVPEAFSVGESPAVAVVAAVLDEARGPPLPLKEPPSFLRRFLNPEEVAAFLEQGLSDLAEAGGIDEIPHAVWPLYEVVGAETVGIPCRCGVDPSLNARGACSGIIGRPMQASCDGREPELASASEWIP